MPDIDPEVRFAYQVLAAGVIYTAARDVYCVATGQVPRDLDTRTNSYCNRRLKTDPAYKKKVLASNRADLEELMSTQRFELYLGALNINAAWFTSNLRDALNGKPSSLSLLKKTIRELKHDATKTYGTTGRGGEDWRANYPSTVAG